MDSLEAGVTPEDVVSGLFDQHPAHRENVQTHLDQDVLQENQEKKHKITRLMVTSAEKINQEKLVMRFPAPPLITPD